MTEAMAKELKKMIDKSWQFLDGVDYCKIEDVIDRAAVRSSHRYLKDQIEQRKSEKAEKAGVSK